LQADEKIFPAYSGLRIERVECPERGSLKRGFDWISDMIVSGDEKWRGSAMKYQPLFPAHSSFLIKEAIRLKLPTEERVSV
jgi:hypothetical protein